MRRIILFLFFAVPLMSGGNASATSYDKSYVGEEVQYKALYEDTFVHLARDYNLGFVEMRAANPGIDPWLPGKGTKLTLPTRHLLPDAPREGIVINLPEMRLYAYGEDGPVTFPLGVGREGLETPIGTTKIRAKARNPSWRPTARMRREDPELPEVVEPGPENPLGNRILYLGWPQYAIHGTNRPFGIGRRISSGCIRLYPEDILKLYDLIEVETKVTVVDQPIKVGWIDNTLYMEVHPTLERSIEVEEEGKVSAPNLSENSLALIYKVAGKHQDRLDWPVIRKAVQESKGSLVAIARRSAQEIVVSKAHQTTAPDEKAVIQKSGIDSVEQDDQEEELSEPAPLIFND